MTQPDPNKGLRTAGTVGIWVMIAPVIALIVSPLLACLGCFGLGIIGSAVDSTP